MRENSVRVIGAGLAGCEAAWQLAKRGVPVCLCEMKPQKLSPAHHSAGFAELVCSNSLRSDRLENAVGLLKEEMRVLDSLVMRAADACRVPAGGALAVDRELFSRMITEAMRSHPNIEVVEGEVDHIERDGQISIIATGPLTSDALSREIERIVGDRYLHFFDAAAPIVSAESIDMTRAFAASRYDRGSDYLNCPMNRREYEAFYRELISAECVALKDFEMGNVFEGCMPVEVMAARGPQTLLFGPLKPVGLTAPDGTQPYAVVQLRREDAQGRFYNLVGFQTHLKFPEQKRVFGMIPGLEKAEFLRYGVMHRNTFLNSPGLLDGHYRLMANPNLLFAGQMTGVEGYVESAASGLHAGICAAHIMQKRALPVFSAKTAIGALACHVSASTGSDFQPMNINFGIMEPLGQRIRKKAEKNLAIAQRALEEVRAVAQSL